MANIILTPTMITREALRILHNKLTYVGSINRQYDSRFAQEGAKIGTTLQIRLPNLYKIRTTAPMQVQDTYEQKIDLTVATQYGVDVNFSSVELTMSLDDFSKRIIEPAMAVLSSNIEAKALDMVYDIYQCSGATGTPVIPTTLAYFTLARAILNRSLTPKENAKRHALIDSATMASLVEGLKTLFHQGASLEHQYKEGFIQGSAGGFMWWENDLAPVFATGSTTNTTPLMKGATLTGATTISVKGFPGATSTVLKGQVLTISGVYAVHPETKAAYGQLQQFVVTENAIASGNEIAALKISPTIYGPTSGALQNVSALPQDNAPVLFFEGTGSYSSNLIQNVVYHEDAFTFVTADLEMPKGVDFAAREVYDGISMRIVRNYDIINDKFPCRIDVLFGYKTLRAQMACRIPYKPA